ncbi:MAG: conjugal transfer protein TraF [Oleibacter sp.]|nr:conjugal transfer protein TraF [Thalassolituus sp.]
MKKLLLASALSAIYLPASATPFMPMDARGLAMGNTGVASAKLAHAPAYNPSLLAQAKDSDDFAIIFPQFGINVADEDNVIDEGELINDDLVPQFEEEFSDSNSDNFNTAIDNVSASAEQLSIQIDSLDDNDGRTNQQKATDLRNDNKSLEDNIRVLQTKVNEVDAITNDLTKSLASISGNPLRARAGVGTAMAFPGKKLAVALTVRADANISGRVLFSDDDLNLINGYGDAANGYLGSTGDLVSSINNLADQVDTGSVNTDDINQTIAKVDNVTNYTSDPLQTQQGSISIIDGGDLNPAAEDPAFDSYVEIAAIAIAEVGISFAREFSASDRTFTVGITPKLQKVATYHAVQQISEEDNAPDVKIEDSEITTNHINFDIGASFYLDNSHKWRMGVVVLDAIGKDFDIADVAIDGDADGSIVTGTTVSISPKLRTGVSYEHKWLTVSSDLDITRNEPLAYENATQYASIGMEADIASFMQLRTGFRTNLAGNSNVVSAGLGLSPFGLSIDFAVMADISSPERDLGAALETGFRF